MQIERQIQSLAEEAIGRHRDYYKNAELGPNPTVGPNDAWCMWEGTNPDDGMPWRIVWSKESGQCFEVHGGICQTWLERGGCNSDLGLPLSDEEDDSAAGRGGRISRFRNGTIRCRQDNDGWKFRVDLSPETAEMTLSEKTKVQLARMDADIQKLRDFRAELNAIGDCDLSVKEMDDILSEIDHRRRAFDSKRFFMVTFGMLKAGKSTLVNTFVGKKVSPVGRAKETTLRSSIILAADDENPEGIYLFSPKTGAASNDDEAISVWQKDNGLKLMDFLNGMTTRDEFRASFKVDFLEFSEANLEKFLTWRVIPEFPNILPPVIRIDVSRTNSAVRAANLLEYGVAIFDTPGLDGAKANKDSDPFWKSLTSCGDYYLLVQSSMSAINKDCVDLIAKIYQETESAPLLVVFNEIAASFWQLPEVEKENLRKDSQTASCELAEQLREKLGGKLPESISINAGEASDAIFGNSEEMGQMPEEMSKESRIEALRERIVKTLREERMSIKVRNAKSRMVKILKESIGRLDAEKNRLTEQEQKISGEENKSWTERKNKATRIRNAFEEGGYGAIIAREFGSGMTNILTEEKEKRSTANMTWSTSNPWQEYKGFGRDHKENTDYVHKAEVDKTFQKMIDDFKNWFTKNVGNQFSYKTLSVNLEQWKVVKDRVSVQWEVIKADCAETDRLPDCLLEDVDIDELTKGLDIPQKPDVSCVPWAPYRNRKYGSDSVWEYECARTFDSLKKSLEEGFDEVAESIGDAFRDAIIEKGRRIAKAAEDRLQTKIREEEEKAKARKNATGQVKDKLNQSIQTMENMKRILEEG